MNSDEFARAFEEELQLPAGTVAPATTLASISQFDSMGRLAIMAMVDTRCGVVLDADRMNACRTVGDLHALVSHQCT